MINYDRAYHNNICNSDNNDNNDNNIINIIVANCVFLEASFIKLKIITLEEALQKTICTFVRNRDS